MFNQLKLYLFKFKMMLSVHYRDNSDEPFTLGRTIMQSVMGNNRRKTFEWEQYTNAKPAKRTNGSIGLDESIEHLVSIVSNILKETGFHIDSSKYDVDFHRYNLFGKKHSTPFAWHEDDYGSTGYEVNTAILYLRKDKTIKGGDLLIKGENKVIVEENTMVLIDGRVIHKPEDLEGFGCRDSIVVQFPRV